ncbi:MAG: DUF1365 domain-containing protein [Leptospiraceae bacterium]|nr:DUF1365 domain-containing protein [Leptospiraceae bacterium]MCP5493290.1 DUF1365 domain-containing protein [Leptospiraceae bacterium]
MDSAIFDCSVVHHRKLPFDYKFRFNFFWFYINLDEIETLSKKISIFSYNKFNIFSLLDKDHAYQKNLSVKENVKKFLIQNDIHEEIQKIYLLTNCRLLNYVFNPVSYYFIETTNNKKYAVIEICNTFGEIKPYFVESECFDNSGYTYKCKKFFYISPFTKMDNELTFKVNNDQHTITIHILDHEDKNLILSTHLKGKRQDLNTKNLFWKFFKYPFITLRIILEIHYHALILYLKKLSFKQKSDDLELQQGAYKWKP